MERVPNVDLNAAMAKIAVLTVGECLIYHRGDLAFDRENRSNPEFTLVDAVGNLAWELYKAKRITLVRSRFGDLAGGCFNYMAVGLPPPRRNS